MIPVLTLHPVALLISLAARKKYPKCIPKQNHHILREGREEKGVGAAARNRILSEAYSFLGNIVV